MTAEGHLSLNWGAPLIRSTAGGTCPKPALDQPRTYTTVSLARQPCIGYRWLAMHLTAILVAINLY
jgi:hypothetical protein